MTTCAHRQTAAHYHISLAEPDDFESWRDHARQLVQAGIAPEAVTWSDPDGSASLFGHGQGAAPMPPPNAPVVRASKQFVELTKAAICHTDALRFDLLYRLLWRLQSNPRLLEDRADLDVLRLDELARIVRRDIHKMRAFVRFRCVEQEGVDSNTDRYVAWFEPEHHILRANAGFFVRRFANMQWSILTPRGSLHWNGETLEEGPPAKRSDAPGDDPTEDLWRSYYTSIFNPARLKIGAMVKEMPRKYWKNLPEAALIPALVAGAQQREAQMVTAGALDRGKRPDTLTAIDTVIHTCRQCPIGELQNRSVIGEGPQDAVLMILGEQPGDQEDEAGRPFVGPAGQLLDRHLERAQIDRGAAYVTNAVKHFKFTARGTRRIHRSPTAKEIDTCRWWLESERRIVQPRLVLALGASAARAILGKTVSVAQTRGRPIALEDGSELWVTVHPSYILRLDGEACEEHSRLFDADLQAVKQRLHELAV